MKRKSIHLFLLVVACLTAAILLTAFTAGCGEADEYLRLHIRADANTPEAQAVKLAVRDAVVAHLTPMARGVDDKREMQALLAGEMDKLTRIADDVLYQYGYSYHARCYLSREKFPTKTYGDLTLAEGYYDALVIELGSGTGDNWWCVAFPPLCFVAAEDTEGDEIVYRSAIAEWFRKNCR